MVLILTIPLSKIKAYTFDNGVEIDEQWLYENVYIANDINYEEYPLLYMDVFSFGSGGISVNLYKENDSQIKTIYKREDGSLWSDFNNKEFYGISFDKNGKQWFKSQYTSRSYRFTNEYRDNESKKYMSNFDIVDSKTGEIIKMAELSEVLNSQIKIKYTIAQDIEGIELANIRVNYQEYNSDRIYQIKIGNSEWKDVSDSVAAAAKEGYYYYELQTYYNQKIEARILENSSQVEYNSKRITVLHDFEMIVNHAPAEDLEGRFVNTITVDLFYCWENDYTYQYSFDNETFYKMDVSKGNKRFIFNHGVQTFLYFRILDKENKVIYTKDYKEIFDGITKHIHVKEDYKTENDIKYIVVDLDLSEYTSFQTDYNFTILVNNVELELNQRLLYEDHYLYNITKEMYENFQELNIEIYIDNFLVEAVCYSPKYGGLDFDNKYNEIVEDKFEDELGDQDYSTVGGMIETVKKFITAVSEYIQTFFKLIMRFFNRLNIWIRTFIISEFAVIIICRIIKVARR